MNLAKERLDRVPLILKRFRQAVLAAACSGELTREWRGCHADSTSVGPPSPTDIDDDFPFELPPGWMWARLGDLARFINGDRSKNYPSKAYRVAEGIPFINAGHLVSGAVDCREMDYITEERFDLLSGGKVQPGDVLYCLRGSLGKCALVKGIAKGAIASSLVIIRSNTEMVSERFVFHYLTSPLATTMMQKYDNGSAQPNLSAADVARYLFPLPPLREQGEVVAAIARFLALADAIEHRVHTATSHADRLPQAILSKAFSGELVSTEADLARAERRTYETAEELLSRVRAVGPPANRRVLRRRERAPGVKGQSARRT